MAYSRQNIFTEENLIAEIARQASVDSNKIRSSVESCYTNSLNIKDERNNGRRRQSTLIESLENSSSLNVEFAQNAANNIFRQKDVSGVIFNGPRTYPYFTAKNIGEDKTIIINSTGGHYYASLVNNQEINEESKDIYTLDSSRSMYSQYRQNFACTNTQFENDCPIHAIENALILDHLVTEYKRLDRNTRNNIPLQDFININITEAVRRDIFRPYGLQTPDERRLLSQNQRLLLLEMNVLNYIINDENNKNIDQATRDSLQNLMSKLVEQFINNFGNFNEFKKQPLITTVPILQYQTQQNQQQPKYQQQTQKHPKYQQQTQKPLKSIITPSATKNQQTTPTVKNQSKTVPVPQPLPPLQQAQQQPKYQQQIQKPLKSIITQAQPQTKSTEPIKSGLVELKKADSQKMIEKYIAEGNYKTILFDYLIIGNHFHEDLRDIMLNNNIDKNKKLEFLNILKVEVSYCFEHTGLEESLKNLINNNKDIPLKEYNRTVETYLNFSEYNIVSEKYLETGEHFLEDLVYMMSNNNIDEDKRLEFLEFLKKQQKFKDYFEGTDLEENLRDSIGKAKQKKLKSQLEGASQSMGSITKSKGICKV